jgi:hypothetical protein
VTLPLQIAFLTGQSDPEGCALAPSQTAFLESLPAPPSAKLARNFPYWESTPPHRETGLLRASWNNGRQYAAARHPTFAARYRPDVLAMLERAERHVLLAGSCGLELLAALALPADVLARVHVFAYGPVARRRPSCDLLIVQGRRDWLSRAYFPAADARVDCGHLDYLECPAVRDLCRAFLARQERNAVA